MYLYTVQHISFIRINRVHADIVLRVTASIYVEYYYILLVRYGITLASFLTMLTIKIIEWFRAKIRIV